MESVVALYQIIVVIQRGVLGKQNKNPADEHGVVGIFSLASVKTV